MGVILSAVLFNFQAAAEASFIISIDKADIVIGEIATISLEWSKLDSCSYHIFTITVYPPDTVRLPVIRSPDWSWNSTEQPFKAKIQYLADTVGTYIVVGNAFHNGRVPPEDVRGELRVRHATILSSSTTVMTTTDAKGVRFSNPSLLLYAALVLVIVIAVAAIVRIHRYSHHRQRVRFLQSLSHSVDS